MSALQISNTFDGLAMLLTLKPGSETNSNCGKSSQLQLTGISTRSLSGPTTYPDCTPRGEPARAEAGREAGPGQQLGAVLGEVPAGRAVTRRAHARDPLQRVEPALVHVQLALAVAQVRGRALVQVAVMPELVAPRDDLADRAGEGVGGVAGREE